ncbi:MAG TPA: hypothetical protein VHC22_03585 [Pirellulales bacterium]|nr:hypothetical protein [Pirellulales bacterium]
MAYPITGILAAVAAAAGIFTLWWYYRLSKEEQEQADRAAAEYARKFYNTALQELSSHQLKWVIETVKCLYA